MSRNLAVQESDIFNKKFKSLTLSVDDKSLGGGKQAQTTSVNFKW